MQIDIGQNALFFQLIFIISTNPARHVAYKNCKHQKQLTNGAKNKQTDTQLSHFSGFGQFIMPQHSILHKKV